MTLTHIEVLELDTNADSNALHTLHLYPIQSLELACQILSKETIVERF